MRLRGSRVHVRASLSSRRGIDHGFRDKSSRYLCICVALADGQVSPSRMYFAVNVIHAENICGDLRQLFLLIRHGHSFEDAVVTATETAALIAREVCVLRHFLNADFLHSRDTLHDGCNISLRECTEAP